MNVNEAIEELQKIKDAGGGKLPVVDDGRYGYIEYDYVKKRKNYSIHYNDDPKQKLIKIPKRVVFYNSSVADF